LGLVSLRTLGAALVQVSTASCLDRAHHDVLDKMAFASKIRRVSRFVNDFVQDNRKMSTYDNERGVALPIGAVERETGLSKDVLRKWETRYGFPLPERDGSGERIYPADQVARLRLIKRLLDSGMRPSRVVTQRSEVLAELAERRGSRSDGGEQNAFGRGFLNALRAHDAPLLRQSLNRLLRDEGLRRFVQDKLSALIRLVGEAWARGELDIYEEHLFSEVIQSMLRGVVDELNDPLGRPRILMTTLPGEPHGLGLLMVGALASLETAYCLSLGTQTPLQDIRGAVKGRSIDVVALSFSANFSARAVSPALAQLREMLPEDVEIWVGGEGTVRSVRSDDGIVVVDSLSKIAVKIDAWRSGRPAGQREAWQPMA
jgi:DNA-binding transcriptional MerR regulator